MKEKTIQVKQASYEINYYQNLVWKYHRLSYELSGSDLLSKSNTFNGKRELKTFEMTSNFYFEADEKDDNPILLDILKDCEFNGEQQLLYDTLLYIITKFVENEYRMFFIKEEDDFDKSDAEAHRQNLSMVIFAYDNLKELRNLLIMRESDLSRVSIVFDLRNDGNKKQKDYQVEIAEKADKKDFINRQIKNVMDIIHYFGNGYLPSYKFGGIAIEDLTSTFVSEIFEPVRLLMEQKGKESSARRTFKGLVVKVVQDYIHNENFQYKEFKMDERNQKLIAYDILVKVGLIEIELIKKHRDREARIKYIESIPKYIGDYLSIKLV